MIKTTHINMRVQTNRALITYIDDFSFIYEEKEKTVSVEIQHGETYTLIDEIVVSHDNFTIKDLERVALNWIFKNVEVVDCIEKPQEV